MPDVELCALEAIMVEEGDLYLFPEEVIELYKQQPDGPLRAWKRLRALTVLEGDPKRQERQAHWLTRLRLWAAPGPMPGLFTINGFGTRLYGTYDRAEDGTYITTRYATVLFAPVLPLGSYWIRDADGGYEVFGRTPHPPKAWRGPGWVLTALGVLLAIAGALVLSAANTAQVVVYNGYGRPARVQLGETVVELDALGHRSVSVGRGMVDVSATLEGGTVVDSFEGRLSGSGVNVYNVGGRGVLQVEHVSYGKGEPPPGVFVVGKLSHWARLDGWMVEPPESIRSDYGAIRSYLRPIGAHASVVDLAAWVHGVSEPELALQVLRGAMAGGDDEEELIWAAGGMALSQGADIGVLCDGWLTEAPLAIHRHRFCQEHLVYTDLEGQRAKYLALADAHPDSAMHLYLAGRVSEDPLPWYARAIEKDPGFARAHAARGHRLLVHGGDLAEAAEAYARALAADPSLARWTLRQRSVVAQLLGEGPAELAARFEGESDVLLSAARLYALMADPTRYDEDRARVEAHARDNGWSEVDVAGARARLAIVVGRLEDARQARDTDPRIRLLLALSEGATSADRVLPPLEDVRAEDLPLAWLLARGGPEEAAYAAALEATLPGILAVLGSPVGPSRAAVDALLIGQPVELRGPVWFAAWRVGGDARFARLARAWSVPAQLPWFADP